MNKNLLNSAIFIIITLFLSCNSGYYLNIAPAPDVEKISVAGEFCTKEETSQSATAPVKIFFIVDTSGSLSGDGGTDPDAIRLDGVLKVIEKYYPSENIYFAAERFSGSSAALVTDGFTRDESQLTEDALADLGSSGGYTPTKEAIALAKETIQSDIDASQDSELLARTTYMAILFSDGVPCYDGDCDASRFSNRKADVLAAVDDLMSLANSGIKEIVLHSAFLGASDNDYSGGTYEDAQDLMQSVATHGGGNYTHFTDASQIDFINIVESTIKVPFSIEEIIVSNSNLKLVKRELSSVSFIAAYPDSDGDGIVDYEEEQLGTDEKKKDTDGDGISDFTEMAKGMDPTKKDYNCAAPSVDSDQDGLSDCEETLLGTAKYNYDTDGDLIPDGIEVFNGLDPNDGTDVTKDPDGDGRTNFDEIKYHTNPTLDDSVKFNDESYTYQWTLKSSTGDGYACYDVQISNIGVIETLSIDSATTNDLLINIMQEPPASSSADKILNLGKLDIPSSNLDDIKGTVYKLEDVVFHTY
jgi:hypothetical protein